MENAEIDRLVMKPTARRRLGKYVLLGRIGHGGMGKIYLAYAPGPAGIEKLLVVKRLHSHLTGDPVLVNSFLDEARLSMALNHPNIVNTFDVGEVDGRYFMVMEYIDGQNLGVLLRTAKRSGEYPSSVLWAGVFLSVLDGLHAAHIAKDARGRALHIIHRDVSPQNVLITYEGLPKLVDFGIAKAAMRVSETDAGVLKGKYAYMSPEQVRGDPLDARSDVFAAGIVLWEMLAGRRLYKADTIVRSVERILTEPPISPVRVNADCDPEIARLAFKALQKDREQRFSSALEFREALDEVVRKAAKRTRQSDVRDLMTRLFGDVIEKQRAVLEQCLAQTDADAHAPIAGGDDDDGDAASRGAGRSDSESDLSIGKLSRRDGSEVTTPSAIRASPLVTGEGEMRAENAMSPPTSMDRLPQGKRGKGSSGGKAGLVVDIAAAPTMPAPAAPGPSPAAAGAARAFDGAEATATSANGPPKRSPVVVPIFGAAVVVALGLLAFAVVVDPWGAKDPVANTSTGTGDNKPDGVKPVDTNAVDVKPVDVNPVDTNPVDVKPVDIKPIVASTEPVVADDGRKKIKRPLARDKERDRSDKASDRASDRGDKASERDKAGDKSGDKAGDRGDDAKAVDTAEARPGDGTLTLDTVPWTVVYLGKKKLGETPLNKVPVPAGALELLLVNPEANVRETYIANVKPGAEYRARLDLN
jgi:serine/threonine protein kinase